MARSSGEVLWQGMYDAFGDVTETVTHTPNNIRFPGQWLDRATGLHQNYFRDYNPAFGRYVQRDPIGLLGGVNVYGYGEQKPTKFIDPTGELAILAPIVPIGNWIGANWGVIGAGVAAGAIMSMPDDSSDDENNCSAPGTPSVDPDCDEINRKVQETKPSLWGFGKGRAKCLSSMSRIELATRKALWLEHAKARSRSIDKCWHGGDETHQQQTADAWRNVSRCANLLRQL
ncbi:RHS repeat-associated core domain-containing protein [Thaumasiovibrio sp. DFM-14]|uniref:RHS repeat-associated core domain-containing protein n=1 Tax=Thaumasiovibrio sp. DFM-14 TaxID=3384792 RepID=UPI00399F5306